MQTGQSNKLVCVEKRPLFMRHMTNAAVAAVEEQECRALLKVLWRERAPEHAKHARIRTQVGHQSRTAT